MKHFVAIDISTFIWCEDDFQRNASHYYGLMTSLPQLFENINSNRSCVLLRDEMKYQILLEFPYSITDSQFFDFQNLSLTFLTNLGNRMITFPGTSNSEIDSIPQLIKKYYSSSTKIETEYLITRLYSGKGLDSKFFTYSYFWPDDKNLKVVHKIQESKRYDIETILFDDSDKLQAFFLQFRRIFKHSEKHDVYKASDIVSRLSCYNERSGDTTKAQQLLDTAEVFEETLYNFDLDNNVYVIFRNTMNNVYHGFDESNRTKIPQVIRKIFNK